MKRSLLILGAAGIAAATMAQKSERPNVILLVADDLGWGDLSCYGATRVSTPTVDSIAASGTRFVDAHACASTSTPSRYSLLTGEYPFRKKGTDVAAGNAGMIISPEQYTVADAFKSAGYKTGAIGKWHLGLGSKTAMQDWNGTLDQDLSDIGFDYHYIMAATADRVPCVFIENGKVSNYDPTAPIYVNYFKNYPGEPTGAENPELLTKLRHSHGHNMSIVNGIGRIGYMKGGGKALWQDENIADSIAARAVDFIRDNKDNPFFLYLCTNDVHVPRYPHERFRGKSPMGLRGEAILQFDWTVKQVAAALREYNLSDNTVIIITSDNGPILDDGYADRAVELVGDHKPGGPFRGAKYSSFEAGSIVPFIVSWPGKVPAGKVSKALVSQIDNMATLAALAGVDLPEGAGADSRDHLKTWLGQSKASRPFAVKYAANHNMVVRSGKWKYIQPNNGGPMITWGPQVETGNLKTPQLYDMKRAVEEKDNVAAKHPKQVKAFQELIQNVKGTKGYSTDKPIK
ncbi:arylsulphatase A [gut metagenome]|uniref:Arylsulphatase A n=1 Tax=gut metagenome TaxID=749906 RepID=J9GHS7_9ZZZZ